MLSPNLTMFFFNNEVVKICGLMAPPLDTRFGVMPRV